MALRTQIDVQKAVDKVKTNNFLSDDKSDLDSLQIDNNCSIDNISPIDVEEPVQNQPAKKSFVIKTQKELSSTKKAPKFHTPLVKAKSLGNKEQTKSYIYPSSINNLSSKVSEPKRYFFKEQNIFVTTKSKKELFDEIMENSTKQSLQTASTAHTARKSKGSETNWYMKDRTKKCVRAILHKPSYEPESSYIANLDKNDPGRKKVRFMEDLGNAKTSREIGFYSGFDDKRDKKSMKREMLEKNWKEKIVAKH